MVLTAYFVLSLVSRAFLPPSPAQCASIVANLISASGYQDHTTSPSASDSIVNCCHLRPPHPALHVRDDRDTPLLMRGGTAGIDIAVSSKQRSEIFFAEGMDTGLVHGAR